MSSEVYDEILTQSNLYADQQRNSKQDTSPWNPITKEELVAFIGVIIAMGVVQLTSADDYWSTDPILTHPWFRSVFTRFRFRQIFRYLHVADNSKALQRSDPNFDKLRKIRFLIDAFSSRCMELYNPHPQISIDESMIGTKCRLSFIQYLPKKPVKWGIKVWVCADAVNGYIYTFDVYCGANSTNAASPNGIAYGVVFKLIEPCLQKGYTVYMDNYYSSPLLFKDLLAAGTNASGTLRSNRKNFPECLKQNYTSTPRGTTTFAFHNNVTVVKWWDNRDVYAMSTLYSNDMTKVKRHVDGSVKEIPCPEIIADYNSFMGGVDLADQAMCYYSLGRKTLKWWRRVFWRLHDMAITNAFVVYKMNNATSLQKTQTNRQFCLTLAEKLMAGVVASRRGPGRPPAEVVSRLTGKHFPYRNGVKQRCCVYAYKRRSPRSKKYKDKKVTTWCPKCEVHLCIGHCFECYHTRVNFKH